MASFLELSRWTSIFLLYDNHDTTLEYGCAQGAEEVQDLGAEEI